MSEYNENPDADDDYVTVTIGRKTWQTDGCDDLLSSLGVVLNIKLPLELKKFYTHVYNSPDFEPDKRNILNRDFPHTCWSSYTIYI